MRNRMLAGVVRGSLFSACVVLPAWLWPHGAVLGYLAQTAALVVLALSYNLQLGTTGLLSFGHAAFAASGARSRPAHWFNHFGGPLPLLPLVGGVAGAGFGFVAGLLATRRAGTAFAMITLSRRMRRGRRVERAGLVRRNRRRADRPRERHAVGRLAFRRTRPRMR